MSAEGTESPIDRHLRRIDHLVRVAKIHIAACRSSRTDSPLDACFDFLEALEARRDAREELAALERELQREGIA